MSKINPKLYSSNQTGTKLQFMPTSHDTRPTNHIVSRKPPNDIGFRVILIPFFGIAIPIVSGMISGRNFSNWQVKLSFLYTIFIAFAIWEGNRYLLFSIRTYVDWYNRPVRKILVLLFGIGFYTVPVSVLLLMGWYRIFGEAVNWQTIFTAALIIMICVIFITHVYETVFLVRESESEMLRAAQLERSKAEAEVQALKNQIDPHFIFNSLNTLSYLIDEKPLKAKLFNDNLADVYRYILQNRNRDLVLLQEEINFLNDYFSLLQIRFEKAVQLQVNLDPLLFQQYLIAPISLQLLMENAIKHNEFSDDNPLVMEIDFSTEGLRFRNEIRKKTFRNTSPKTGLQNLNERSKLIIGKAIAVAESDGCFVVVLPILKIA